MNQLSRNKHMKTLNFRFFVLGAVVATTSACNIKPADALPTPKAAKVESFTVSPTSVAKPGDMVTLTWATSDATSVSVEHVGVGPLSTTAMSGSATVAVERNATFVITARGEGGTDALARGVTVGSAASDLLFAALPASIDAGESATLTWFAPGAKNVSLTEVGGAAVDIGMQKENGAVTVTPARSTSWKLTADDREATASVTVVPAITHFALASAPPLPGGTVKLEWTSAGGQSLVLKRAGAATPLVMEMNAAKVAAGDFLDTVPADLPMSGQVSYTLEVTNGTTTVTAPLTVNLAGAFKILSFDAAAWAKPNTDTTVSWKTQGAASVRLLVDGAIQYQSTSQATTDQSSFPVRVGTTATKVTLVARSAFGGELRRERTIGLVGAVAAPTFSVSPGTLPGGGAPVTLTWSAMGARRVKIVENGLLTVALVTGTQAESGTAQAWPNTATTTYELFADNTVDPAQYARATVAVTAPVKMMSVDGGTVFTNQGAIDLAWSVDGGATGADGGGTEVIGLPTVDPEVDSTGFDDISTTGTEVLFATGDQDVVQIKTDFDAVLGGRRVSGAVVTVGTNGALALGPTLSASNFPASTWPSSSYEQDFIAPYWADLDGVASVHWQVKGSAPNQVLIVQWTKVKRKSAPMSELTFQARVSQSGQVDFEYATFVPNGTTSQLVGVSTSRGVGAGSTASPPSSNKRRRFFGPVTSAPNFATSLFNLTPVRGYVRMSSGGLMQLGFDDHVRPEELAISEVMYAPIAPYADAGEWFEVVNRSPRPVDLTGWLIDFGNLADGGFNRHTIASPMIVPPGGVKVFGQSGVPFEAGLTVDYAYGTEFAMNDVSGTVAIARGALRFATSWTASSADAGIAAIFDPNPVIGFATSSTLGPKTCRPPATTTYGSQRGSPGRDTTCLGYRMARVDQHFRDLARIGTRVALTNALGTVDFSSAPVTLWSNQVTALTVSRSGWALPGPFAGANVTSNKSRPTLAAPMGTIAPFWDDLVLTPASDSGVFVKRFAAGDDVETPAPHWIVQWSHLSSAFGVNDDVNFEVKFFDSGAVEYHYGSMESGSSSTYGAGTSATMWFEYPDAGSDGGTGAAIAVGINAITLRPTNTLAWRFTPAAP